MAKKRRRRGLAARPPKKDPGIPPVRRPTSANRERRRARVPLALLSAGFIVAVYLTYVHYRLHVAPGWRSACDIDPAISCDEVVLSAYGSVRGVPLSMVALWFYGIGIILWLRRSSTLFRSWVTVLFLAASIATAASIVLALISVAVIGALCVLCAVLYAVNGTLTIATWRAMRAAGEGLREAVRLERAHWKGKRWLALGVLLLAVAPLAVVSFLYSNSAGGSVVCDAIAKSPASGGRIEMITYSDFQCRHCRELTTSLQHVPRDGGIHFVWRHYPLDKSCNPYAKRTRYPGSCSLAIAAICSELQGGRSRDLADALFDDPSSDPGHLVRLATSLGMDGKAFEACFGSDRAKALLRENVESAAAHEVDATPTMFINGRRRVGRLQPAEIECIQRGAARTSSAR